VAAGVRETLQLCLLDLLGAWWFEMQGAATARSRLSPALATAVLLWGTQRDGCSSVDPFFSIGNGFLWPAAEALQPPRYHFEEHHFDGEKAADISCGEAAVQGRHLAQE
jgi:hypothetical protein